MHFSMEKFLRLILQKLFKSCWPSKAESWLPWVICWSNFIRIATHSESRLWNIAKSTRKSGFHSSEVFSTRAILRLGHYVKREFRVNSKDQLGDLNQKLITAINTLDGSTLGDYLMTSHQVDYMFTALIPAKAVENN